MPKLEKYLMIDENVREAFVNYFLYGLDPGSFGRAVLALNYEEAITTAHYLLRADKRDDGIDCVADHLELVKRSMPKVCRGTRERVKNWMDHKGISGLMHNEKFADFVDSQVSELIFLKMTEQSSESKWYWGTMENIDRVIKQREPK